MRTFQIAGRPFDLGPTEVVRAVRQLDPEPISRHHVVVGSRRYPPKQVIGAVTGLDRADFTTHHARRTLMRLGFPVGRREVAARTGSPEAASASASGTDGPERLADRLPPLAGQWVAVKDDDVLHAAKSPKALVGWLSRHGQVADSVFRVPEDELAGSGLAPL